MLFTIGMISNIIFLHNQLYLNFFWKINCRSFLSKLKMFSDSRILKLRLFSFNSIEGKRKLLKKLCYTLRRRISFTISKNMCPIQNKIVTLEIRKVGNFMQPDFIAQPSISPLDFLVFILDFSLNDKLESYWILN